MDLSYLTSYTLFIFYDYNYLTDRLELQTHQKLFIVYKYNVGQEILHEIEVLFGDGSFVFNNDFML